VFADNLVRARHLTVAPSGDVYVNTWSSSYTELKNAPGGYLVALRDSNRDGKADQIERFGPVHQNGKVGGGTGIAVHRGALFVEDNGTIVRYRLGNGPLAPQGNPDVILSWTERGHIMHPFAITSTMMSRGRCGESRTPAVPDPRLGMEEEDVVVSAPNIGTCVGGDHEV
jgi:hypothetical protein